MVELMRFLFCIYLLLMICTTSPKFAIGKDSVLEQLPLKRTLDIHFLIYKQRIVIWIMVAAQA